MRSSAHHSLTMARLRGHLGAGPPPQPHVMPPSSLFPWVSCRPQNRRDHCLVPGEQVQRPLVPPLHAHPPSSPAGPVQTRRPGVAIAGGLGVHSGQGLCPTPQSGPFPPSVPWRRPPEGQTGLVGRGGDKDPKEQSWRPHGHPCHMGRSSELAGPQRAPCTPGPASPRWKAGPLLWGVGRPGSLEAPSQGFWGRKGPSSRAEHPRDHARTSQGIKGPRPQSRPAPPPAGSLHGRGRWGTEGYRLDAFGFAKMFNKL